MANLEQIAMLEANRSRKIAAHHRGELSRMVSIIQRELQHVDTTLEEQFTGWHVLLRKKGEKWVALGCINDSETVENDERLLEECELILPIPDPTTVKEFTGF